MANKHGKTSCGHGVGSRYERWVTRSEVKDAGRKDRRVEDRKTSRVEE